jgi:four helix bundle protein
MTEQRQAAKTFRDLLVWQKVHAFVLAIYKMTAAFPGREIYGLTSQMRRAAVFNAANIAQGFVKRGKADKARFMNVTEGSIEESRYYLILSEDLGCGSSGELVCSTAIAEQF